MSFQKRIRSTQGTQEWDEVHSAGLSQTAWMNHYAYSAPETYDFEVWYEGAR